MPFTLWIGVRADGWWLWVTRLLRGRSGERERSPRAAWATKVTQVTLVVVAAVWVTWRLV